MAASRPAEVVLTEDATTDAVRTRLEKLADMRRFAVEELHLTDSDSYRDYADLDREAMVWSVVAAPWDSLEPRQWCYLVVGCASYRGYFNRAAAELARNVRRYELPNLLALNFVLIPFGSITMAYLQRQMQFRLTMTVRVTSSLVASATSVALQLVTLQRSRPVRGATCALPTLRLRVQWRQYTGQLCVV